MIDYENGINLARDVISLQVRVSTASFPSVAYYGAAPDALIETWIFSENQKVKTVQIFHKDRSSAVKRHKAIVAGLKRLLGSDSERH